MCSFYQTLTYDLSGSLLTPFFLRAAHFSALWTGAVTQHPTPIFCEFHGILLSMCRIGTSIILRWPPSAHLWRSIFLHIPPPLWNSTCSNQLNPCKTGYSSSQNRALLSLLLPAWLPRQMHKTRLGVGLTFCVSFLSESQSYIVFYLKSGNSFLFVAGHQILCFHHGLNEASFKNDKNIKLHTHTW